MRNQYIQQGITILLIGILAWACDTKKPGVDNDKFKSPAFDHTGVVDGCSECHEAKRLADPHPQKTDCSACHAYPEWGTLTTAFTHNPTPSSCNLCHEKKRPVDPHPQTTDCSSCHAYPNWTKLTTSFTHTPTPSSCAACHEDTRPKRSSHPASGDCKSCHKYGSWNPSN